MRIVCPHQVLKPRSSNVTVTTPASDGKVNPLTSKATSLTKVRLGEPVTNPAEQISGVAPVTSIEATKTNSSKNPEPSAIIPSATFTVVQHTGEGRVPICSLRQQSCFSTFLTFLLVSTNT